MKTDIAQESLKAAPPVAVSASVWMVGLSLNEVVLLATLGYIGLQAAYLIWKWYREWRRSRK